MKNSNFYKPEDYNLSEIEEKMLLAIGNRDNFYPTPYLRCADKKSDMHMWTLDARKAAKSVSKLLMELKIIPNDI